MIIIRGYDGGTPTVKFSGELARKAPDLFAQESRTQADLLIIPRSTDDNGINPANPEAWYDMHWAHQQVLDASEEIDDDQPCLMVVHTPYQFVASIPQPPRIPAEQRLANLPELNLDGLEPDTIAFFGGPDRALEHLRRQQQLVVINDRTVNAYDWEALAETTIATIRNLGTPPKLSTVQRAQVAAARLQTARWAVSAAEQSLAEHLRQAGDVELPDAFLVAPTSRLTRSHLSSDPEYAYRHQIAPLVATNQVDGKRLTSLQDKLMAEVAGSDRGGVARVARLRGVSNTSAGDLLVSGLFRSIRSITEVAGINVMISSLGQAHPARVSVTAAGSDIDALISLFRANGLVADVGEAREVGLVVGRY